MRVYIPNENYEFSHPEDMIEILAYLSEHGEIKVSPKTIENYYYEFSDACYAAGWIGVDEETLKYFAEWLSEIDL